MKKIILLVAVVALGTAASAKEVNYVKEAKKVLIQETPDFQAARGFIRQALTNEDMKGLTETWYVAGLIGHDEVDYLIQQVSMGLAQYDQDYICSVVAESYGYWLVADSLALIPNEKGKVDNTIHRKIASGMANYFTSQYLAGLAYAFYAKGDYNQAVNAYEQYLGMPSLPVFADGKFSKELIKDTLYYTFQRYAGLCAYEGKMYDKAIALLSAMNSPEVTMVAKEQDVIYANEFLYNVYMDTQDTIRAIALLEENVQRFPKTPWFLQNLINSYIAVDKMTEAIHYLDMATQNDPKNALEYLSLKGNMLANAKQYEQALQVYQEVLARDSHVADAYAGQGRVYFNQGLDVTNLAADIQDNNEYKAQLKIANGLFKHALPLFEQASSLDPENTDYQTIIRQLKYRLEQYQE